MTAHMAVRTQPAISPGLPARVTEAMTLSHSSFRKRYKSSYETPSSSLLASSSTLLIRKRYWGTSELVEDSEIEVEESDVEGTDSEREESEDKGPESEGEEDAPKGQQQQESPVEDTTADEPLSLGYGVARLHALKLAEDPAPNIEFDPPSRVPVQTPASPEWSSGSLPVSLASLTIPLPIASPATTPAATIAIDEDKFLELGAQLELHKSILHDYTQHLDALQPTLLEGHGRDITVV
ncbi:hypothetical protein Tco_1558574 [Tanacetum coccineum]